MDESTMRNTIPDGFQPSDVNEVLDDTPITIPRSQLQLLQLHVNELQKDVQTAKAETRHYIREAQWLTREKEKIHTKTRKLYQAIELAKSQCKKRLGKRMTMMDNQIIREKRINRDLREEIVQEREMAHGFVVNQDHRSGAPVKAVVTDSELQGQREVESKKRKMGSVDESVGECTGSIKRMRLDESLESTVGRATAKVTGGIETFQSSAEPSIEDMVEEDLSNSFLDVDKGYAELTREVEEYGRMA